VPATSRHYPFLDHPGPIPFAHRGGALYPPNVAIENSMAAFANAIELGYRYLETDVHATADGVLVAFHDPTLDRVTDRSGRIADLPYAEVARARIAGREPIPTLAEILGTWPDVRVNIDVKHENAIRPLAETVAKTNAHDRICVSSFSGHRVKEVHRLLGPRVATGVTPFGVALLTVPLPQLLRRLVLSDAPCVQVPVSYHGLRIVTPDFIARAHALGKHVHVWTIDEPTQMNDLLDMGVDGIITDRIDHLRDVLTARGQWVE
jgi:glycerophosphoryl diester phosphodiesterase